MNRIKNFLNIENALPEAECRDNVELLRRRICLLDGKDRMLMSMYFQNGSSCYQIARLLGVCDATITRRIRKLTEHLIGEPFQRYRQFRKQFDSLHKDIARDHFLMALSIQQIAEKRNYSFYKVRTALKEIKSIIKSNPKPPPIPNKSRFINRTGPGKTAKPKVMPTAGTKSIYLVLTAKKEINSIIKTKPKTPPMPKKARFINRQNRRIKVNHGNIQHIKKFQMVRNNNRPRSMRLSYVRPDYRKASGI